MAGVARSGLGPRVRLPRPYAPGFDQAPSSDEPGSMSHELPSLHQAFFVSLKHQVSNSKVRCQGDNLRDWGWGRVGWVGGKNSVYLKVSPLPPTPLAGARFLATLLAGFAIILVGLMAC